MTIVPRTGPLSASSALATTSWYQRGKSSDWGVSTVLAMGSILRSGPHRSTRHFLRPLHRGDHERLPRLPAVGELTGAAGLLEYACGGVPGHRVEVAGDLHVGTTPDVAAHRLDGLHLGVGPTDEARPLGSEATQVDVDVVVVRGVEEVGQDVGELVVQAGGGSPVEREATAQLGRRGVAPRVVAQRGEVAAVGAQSRDVDGLARAVPRRRRAAHPGAVGPDLVRHLADVPLVQG